MTSAPSRRAVLRRSGEVHGLLWVVDEIHRNELRTASALLKALRILEQDPAVRLPRGELRASIKRYGGAR
ncbi:MAG: hypothetical protein ACRD21_13360 [Vicinamibacteria bacterium]